MIREDLVLATDDDSPGARVFRTGEPVSSRIATAIGRTIWRRPKACSPLRHIPLNQPQPHLGCLEPRPPGARIRRSPRTIWSF